MEGFGFLDGFVLPGTSWLPSKNKMPRPKKHAIEGPWIKAISLIQDVAGSTVTRPKFISIGLSLDLLRAASEEGATGELE